MTTSLISCSTRDGNSIKETRNIDNDNIPLEFYREVQKIYQRVSGDNSYEFAPYTFPSFTPFTQTVVRIDYVFDNVAPGTTASIGLNDEASIVFNAVTGDIVLTFGRDGGATITETFTVPWASYSSSTFTQLNDNGGVPYATTVTTIAEKIFDISYVSNQIRIIIYENATVNNAISRTITFNPIEVIFGGAAETSAEVRERVILNQNPFLSGAGLDTVPNTETLSTLPIAGFFSGVASPYVGTYGYSLTYDNDIIGSAPDSMTTQIIVADIVPNYFDPDVTESVDDMVTAFNGSTPAPTSSSNLETIIRRTFGTFAKTFNAVDNSKNFNFCVNECKYGLQTIGENNDNDCPL